MSTYGQEVFEKKIVKRYKRRRTGKFEIKAGFYTEKEMYDTLKFEEPRA